MKLKEIEGFDPVTKANIEQWLHGPYDDETKAALNKLLEEKPKEVADAFYTNIEFGTGGLRGIMGIGCNRMNCYTVRAATQGLANYLSKQPLREGSIHSVFIGYDSRHNSRLFAEECAKVLAANRIRVYLCQDLRPTPLVSFGCRYKKCSAAIMITASHNPPAYNGYKLYWNDGAQVLPPHDKNIIEEVKKMHSPSEVKAADRIEHPLIELISDEIDAAYLNAIETLQITPKINQKDGGALKIIYTSLHGTGITLLPIAMERAGFTDVETVEEQAIVDGGFPTVESPNPEEESALKMGVEKLRKTGGDILIATDPDADRVGIAVSHHGKIQILNGNQIACLCLNFILETLTAQERLAHNAAFIKTIATTELFGAICRGFKKPCFNVLTGFKYIAEKIRTWELDPKHPYQFVFGGEESYGYLIGSLTRDKDAITSSILIAETALNAKKEGKTLIDKLESIYNKYGYYQEKLLSLNFGDSQEGKQRMDEGMSLLRKNPPSQLANTEVVSIEDYMLSQKRHLKTNETSPLEFPKSNALLYWLEDGTKLLIRPSGTEPKIKVYCGAVIKNFESLIKAEEAAQKKIAGILDSLKSKLNF